MILRCHGLLMDSFIPLKKTRLSGHDAVVSHEFEMYRNVPSAPSDDAPIVDGWRQGTGGFLLSYPRSGNHLVRVAVEFLAERFTLSAYSWENRDAKGHHTGLVASRIKGTALADRIPSPPSRSPRPDTGPRGCSAEMPTRA